MRKLLAPLRRRRKPPAPSADNLRRLVEAIVEADARLGKSLATYADAYRKHLTATKGQHNE